MKIPAGFIIDQLKREQEKRQREQVANCILFRGLPEQQRTTLAGRARIRAFAKGETIFRMGDSGDCLMAVLAGRVRISVASPEGREMVLAILGPDEILGEITVLDGKERTADATALDACTLAILDRREVLSFLERDPSAWVRVVEILCARLRNTDQHIAEITLLDVPARVASTLLRLIEGEPASRQVKISQSALGQLVGTTRESVNKCLAEWQRSGIVRVQSGSLITVANRTALERFADGLRHNPSWGERISLSG